jgi:O-methyltransferase involved in polyketide biosynthesis
VLFADIDFEHESLRQGLVRHGISLVDPTFLSWLGVTMYLTEEAVDAVIETVAEFPAGSEIVLTFSPPREPGDPAAGPSLAERAAEVGEPWISYFESEQIEQKLRRFGFSAIEFLTPDESRSRYFRDRADQLPAPRRTTIVSAIR